MTVASTADAFAPLPDIIEPKWWTGTPAISPELFTIDGNDFRVPGEPLAPSDQLAQRMQTTFDEIGLVHVINTGLTDMQAMRLIATQVLKNERQYEGGANPRKTLQPNVYEVGAPLEAALHYHHEMAYIDSSTTMVSFMCNKIPAEGGYTFVSDNVAATESILATPFGQKLKKLGICYHRDLTDRDSFQGRIEYGVYNHWQLSMLTDDQDEAIAEARSRGLTAEWGEDRKLKTRYTISAFEYFPHLDRNLLYSSMADDGAWFDTWPLVQHLPPDERPLKLTFGDLTEMTREEKELFIDIYDRHGIPIPWKVGDVGLICNYRFAHGRPGIHLKEGEDRELGVLIGESFRRLQTLEDKW
ncbi:TauD/TfdA family dioxygenase [SAR92 clade bacterium H921]|nr:TauD/TfdA family dioxygenase [SAR92 clade bacterium H921]